MEDKLIDKIRKLITKQKSAEEIGSLAEAAIFAAKIQDLLTKYNLEIADIGDAQEKPKMGKAVFSDIKTRKNEGEWEPLLYSVLAKFNYCMLITHSSGSIINFVSLIGTKDNIEIVKFLGDQLQAKIRILEKMDWQEHGRDTSEKRNTFRRGYFLGAISGIEKQLRDQRDAQMAAQCKVTSLVVQTDKDLKEAVSKLFGSLSTKKAGKSSSSVGKVLGKQRGEGISINKGVDNKYSNKSLT